MKRPIRYPFDKSGRSPNNFIQDEPHQLTPGRDRRIIVPLYIPFYSKSVIITDVATGLQVDSSDFYTADFDETIQRKTGKEVASTIIITNKAISDNVTISYQHVGGVESLVSGNVIREQLNALANDARPIVFDAIIGRPKGYPALPHMHDIGDVYGMEYIVYAIDRLRDAIANGDLNKWLSLYNYIDQQDDNLLQLILKNKADIAETKQQVAVVQDNLDYLSMKIYGTKDKLATKVIKSFMPVSPRIGNRLAWDEHYGGYYLGYRNVEYWRVFIDNVEGTDVPMDVDPNHGTEPTKPYKTIKFALEQRKEAKGFLLFLLKARQEHILPGNMNIKMKGGQEFVFDTYTYDGGVIRSGINYETYKQDLAQIHGLDSLQSYIRDTAATLIIGDLTDSNDPDGFGYTHPRILFELESLLEECLVWFRNIKLHVKNWNRNVILQRVEESSLPEPIKQKARDRVEREVSGSSMTPLFKIPRICFRGCHVITDIQNRENDKFHSLFWNEPYIVVEWANRFSGKIMDMFQVMDVKTDIMFTDPDKVFVDDGTRCTDPTPISLSMVYLIDHLDYGDGHHHWINIRSNIYPDYSGSDALYLSEDYLAGTVSCEPYKLNPLGRPRGNNNDNTDKSIGIPYRDRFGRIYIKSLEDNKYYQIYPAIWHGDQLFPGVDSIQGSVRISLTYRHRDYGGNHGLRDEFLAFDDRKTTINQVWPAVWQDLKDPIPKKELESNTNPPVSQRAYVFFDKTKNRWYISTLDKTVKRIVYPAIWEPGRNLGETVRYQREAHMGTYFGKFDASPAPLSFPNSQGGGVTDPDSGTNTGEWSLGRISIEMGGDQQYRGFRRVVEVLKSGLKVRDEKSNIIQYAGCNTPMKTDNNPNIKPHPSINNKGVVTWDYGNISNYTEYSQLNRLPGDVLPTMDKIGYVDNGVAVSEYTNSILPALIDDYLYLQNKDVLLDYFKLYSNNRKGINDGTVEILIQNPMNSIGTPSEMRRTKFDSARNPKHVPSDGWFSKKDTRCYIGLLNKIASNTNSVENIPVNSSKVVHFVGGVQLNGLYNDLPSRIDNKREFSYASSTHGDTDFDRKMYTPYTTDNPNVKYRYCFSVLDPVGNKNEYIVIVHRHVSGYTFIHNSNHAYTTGFITDVIRIPVNSVTPGNDTNNIRHLSDHLNVIDSDKTGRDYIKFLKVMSEVVKLPKYSGMKFQLSPYYVVRQ